MNTLKLRHLHPSPDRDQQNAGSVVFDNKGNSIWQGHKTGDADLDTTAHLLKRLDNPDLQIDDGGSLSGAGFDPYNKSSR